MTNLIIKRILETVILSLVVLIICSVTINIGYYFAFGLLVAMVQCIQKFVIFRTENRWWLYGIVLGYDVLFWPGAIAISVNKAYINHAKNSG